MAARDDYGNGEADNHTTQIPCDVCNLALRANGCHAHGHAFGHGNTHGHGHAYGGLYDHDALSGYALPDRYSYWLCPASYSDDAFLHG